MQNNIANSEEYFVINLKSIKNQIKKEPLYFWLFCGYIFFEYVRPQSIYSSLDIIPWVKVTIAGTVLSILSSKESVALKSPLTKYYWGLILSVFASALCAEFPAIAFQGIADAVNWLIIFYLFIRVVTTKFRFFIVTFIILMASYKMSQHAAISWARRGFSYEGWGVAGAPGYFGNAADLGVQMLIILPLSIYFFMRCSAFWSSRKKLFFVFLPITTLMTIIAVGERNTLLGLAAMCLVAVAFQKRRVKNMFMILIFVIGLIAIMPKALLDRFDTAGSDNTSISRLTYWNRGIEFFGEHPVLGIGYNNWGLYYQKYYPGESLRNKIQEVAHSTPISVLAELGFVGFIFYYGIAIKTISLNFSSTKLCSSHTATFWRDIPFALTLGTVGFLVASVFLSVTFYPFLFIQASMSAALYNILLDDRKAQSSDESYV